MHEEIRRYIKEFPYAIMAATLLNLGQPIVEDQVGNIAGKALDGISYKVVEYAPKIVMAVMREMAMHEKTDFKEAARQQKMLLILNESYRDALKNSGKITPNLQDRLNPDSA